MAENEVMSKWQILKPTPAMLSSLRKPAKPASRLLNKIPTVWLDGASLAVSHVRFAILKRPCKRTFWTAFSDTSRTKGDGEIDGQDYNFVSR